MSVLRFLMSLFAVAFLLAACGEPERAKALAVTANAARARSEFNQIGKVSLYPGESCASQIMFIFHTGGSTSISLAAPMHESKILTEAAHKHLTVHVWGRWRRGKAPECVYVEATQVEVQKSFW